MNKYFKSAVGRFNKLKKDESFLINPISEFDAEVITEIREVLNKLGATEVLDILKNYKGIKDEEIRDRLMTFNVEHPSLGVAKLANKVAEQVADDIENENKKPVFFRLGDLHLKEYHFLGFELFEEIKSGDYLFGILLNPTPPLAKNIPLYANYKVIFNDEEDRCLVINNLTKFLSDKGIDIIDFER